MVVRISFSLQTLIALNGIVMLLCRKIYHFSFRPFDSPNGYVLNLFQGHYVRVLGEIGDKDTENEVLLLEHDIPHSPFSKLVLKDLPEMPWIITPQVCHHIFQIFKNLGSKFYQLFR